MQNKHVLFSFSIALTVLTSGSQIVASEPVVGTGAEYESQHVSSIAPVAQQQAFDPADNCGCCAFKNLPELPASFIIVISSAIGRASKYVAKQCGLSNNKAHATGLATMVAVSAGLRKFTDDETSPSKPIDYLLQFTADAVAYVALNTAINYLVPAKKEQKSTTAQNQARSQLLTSTQHAKQLPTQPKRMTRVDEKTFAVPSLLPETLQKKN